MSAAGGQHMLFHARPMGQGPSTSHPSTSPFLRPAAGPEVLNASHPTQDVNAVAIGDVELPLQAPARPDLVPVGFADSLQIQHLSQSTLAHLRWMLQKYILGQDMYLIGSPGPTRRRLAIQFCALTQREVEYLPLSRDTTEADLKQRREIRDGTSVYVDQAPVLAAVHGRMLVLEGIEKAERNVLPLINNLLENREMNLEDGRRLIHSNRYDNLLKSHTKEELDALNLVRVHPDFRVIALGVHVPRFPGNPLDPPLRSRFQAREIQDEVDVHPGSSSLDLLDNTLPHVKAGSVAAEKLPKLLAFCGAVRRLGNQDQGTVSLPHLSDSAIHSSIQLLTTFPEMSLESILNRTFPAATHMEETQKETINGAVKQFEFAKKANQPVVMAIQEVVSESPHLPIEEEHVKEMLSRRATLEFDLGQRVEVPVGPFFQSGSLDQILRGVSDSFTESQSHSLQAMFQDGAIGKDICLIGEKGAGKTTVARTYANVLGYLPYTMALYKDMTTRDIFQSRSTTASGDTTWSQSPLIQAMVEGNIIILDGIDQLERSIFGSLQRLIHDREVTLADGTRLLRWDRYCFQNSRLGEMEKVVPIHPGFQIVALATPPSNSNQWLSAEVSDLFQFHTIGHPSLQVQANLLNDVFKPEAKSTFSKILKFSQVLAHKTRDREDFDSLSIRQLLRLCRKALSYPGNEFDNIQRLLLTDYMPPAQKQMVAECLEEAGIAKPAEEPVEIRVESDGGTKTLHIGTAFTEIHKPNNPSLVPNIVFHEVPAQLRYLESMLKDYNAGEHLLLIGNQGVGKNKLADRFLQLLGREQEYMQLHRDTTIQTLTLSPTLQGGTIVWEDSPLVRAVKHGRVLVIDEADKAPLEVVSILKGLIEDGEMLLSDRRRIVRTIPKGTSLERHSDWIPIHPSFRVMVLANRPGYPFHGNDFFRTCGDVFSPHVIDNLDSDSEIRLLKEFGPDVAESTIKALSDTFQDLRKLVADGVFSYPYSTRELVNVVKHLQKYPSDGVVGALQNVFAFDAASASVRDHLVDVFNKYGIPLKFAPSEASFQVRLAPSKALPSTELVGSVNHSKATETRMTESQVEMVKVSKPWIWEEEESKLCHSFNNVRATTFSDLVAEFSVGSEAEPKNVTTLNDGSIHVLTQDPMNIISHKMETNMHPVYTSMNLDALLYRLRFHNPNLLRDLDESSELQLFPFQRLHSNDGKAHEQVLARVGPLLLAIDPWERSVQVVTIPKLGPTTGNLTGAMSQFFGSNKEPPSKRDASTVSVDPALVKDGYLTFLESGPSESSLHLLSLAKGNSEKIHLPNISNAQILSCLSPDSFLVKETGSGGGDVLWSVQRASKRQWKCVSLESSSEFGALATAGVNSKPTPKEIFEKIIPEKFSEPHLMVFGSTDPKSHATVVAGMSSTSIVDGVASQYSIQREDNSRQTTLSSMFHTNPYQMVSLCSDASTKKQRIEVIDIENQSIRTVDVPDEAIVERLGGRPTNETSPGAIVSMVPYGDKRGEFVTLQENGTVRIWDFDTESQEEKFGKWKAMVGGEGTGDLRLELKRDKGREATAPKHGKEDPTNAPHVGGNTWAGGTGGADTAGLGGKGGPYRLDKGHDVHQISDEEKANISAEALEAARKMGKEALEKRLKEINMSEHESGMYDGLLQGVRNQILQLRYVLESLENRAKERVWKKHQTSGDLDDAKLVDGMLGEKAIYRKRSEEDPQFGTMPQTPKRLLFVVDISGSMYRFNGMDQRLDKMLETAVMIMESFHGFEHKYDYAIVGHSGDSERIPLVDWGNPPKNEKERLRVVQMMHAHSQFCWSGDTTVEATKSAMKEIVEKEGDDYYVVVLSDANLARYGISPAKLGDILTSDSRVNGCIMFIASMHNEAGRIKRALPAGVGHVCLDTSTIPTTLKEIFTSGLLRS